jgi:hypothetical protein
MLKNKITRTIKVMPRKIIKMIKRSETRSTKIRARRITKIETTKRETLMIKLDLRNYKTI